MQRVVPTGFKTWVEHYRDPDQLPKHDTRDRKDPIQAITVVHLVSEEDGASIVATGKAFCSTKDQFSKRKGRLIATGRAIKQFHE